MQTALEGQPRSFNALVAAPGFWLGVDCSADAVTGVRFLAAPAPTRAASGAVAALAAEATRQLAAWLADPAVRFDLPLAAGGTDFQRRVWAAIAAIPSGETQSYGAVAAALGSAPRAVGGACGANPLPLIVPCHRVIATSGALGGFARSGGDFLLGVKRWLLQHERRA
ncbi:methylated-DNA--[protein]-cysteine S-methyltransferase [Rhodocyclus tenuis]|uniref:methylated-DNA--[protein]-cysteine S-methyltransferase n=1 Tax=Rhodocyclus tenuis TaxID=1066 RepID=UPI0019065221|nr:methylated-DNA--[protein]-cysteine S-methyltransferase [Rhodocyclus tenuis]MBK1681310.1 cysteine methyltransferase [Rhodocyclus tenuis]